MQPRRGDAYSCLYFELIQQDFEGSLEKDILKWEASYTATEVGCLHDPSY